MSSVKSFFKPLQECQTLDQRSDFKQTLKLTDYGAKGISETIASPICNTSKNNKIKKQSNKIRIDNCDGTESKKDQSNRNDDRKNKRNRPNRTDTAPLNTEQAKCEKLKNTSKKHIKLKNGSSLPNNKQCIPKHTKVEESLTERNNKKCISDGVNATNVICQSVVENGKLDEVHKCRKGTSSKKIRLSLNKIKKNKKGKDNLSISQTCVLQTSSDTLNYDNSNSFNKEVSSSPSNAFQIMMESRKKRIGTNSPGKEVIAEIDPTEANLRREIKAKRKLSLEKLAEAKGALRNREEEEVRDSILKKTLEKRKKSFKVLLQNGTRKKKLPKNQIKEKKSAIKKTKSSCESSKTSSIEIFDTPNTEGKRKRDGHLHLAGNLSKKSKEDLIKHKTVIDEKKKGNVEISDDDFLEKLAPSLRRKESMLSYFEKVESEPLFQLNAENEDVIEDEKNDESIIKVKFNNKAKKKIMKTKKAKKKIIKPESNNEDNSKSVILKSKPVEKKHLQATSKVLNIANSDLQFLDSSEINIADPVPSIEIAENVRPKRMTCKKPLRYTQSTEESNSDSGSESYHIFTPKKNNHKRKKEIVIDVSDLDKSSEVDIVSPIKIINILSPATMRCIRSPNRSTLRKSLSTDKLIDSKSQELPKNVKLAPLFMKNIPKPLVDPELLAAKLKFLQSGMPDYIRKQQEKLTCAVVYLNVFPSISHVQQIPNKLDDDFCIWNLPTLTQIENFHDAITKTEAFDYNCRLFNDYKITNMSIARPHKELTESKSYSCKVGLQEIKRRYANHPVYKIYNQLKQKHITSHISTINKSEDIIDNALIVESNEYSANDNVCSLWTEKYRPTSSTDIIGNMRSINAVKKWLESWKEYNETSKSYKKKCKDSESSSDFIGSDSESRDSARLPNNMIVIVGPKGSGKTSSIYAIANELGMNVLEVNAGSKRTGKRILAELQEATQSHKVLTKMNSDSNNFSGILERLGNTTAVKKKEAVVSIKNEDKKSNLKVSKLSKSRHSKSNSDSRESFSQNVNNDTQKMSLMLIEDADIVFEEDDGFVNALSQIVQSSKRPVILVASDVRCSHLQRFMLERNVIYFYPLMGTLLGPWLDILILIECGKLVPDLSSRLLDFYRGDMRTTILQIQYWLLDAKNYSRLDLNNDSDIENIDEKHVNVTNSQSDIANPELVTHNSYLIHELSFNINLENIWWNISDLFDNLIDDSKTHCNSNVIANESIHSIFNVFESLSSIDVMQSHNRNNVRSYGMVKHPWQSELTDSLSESEDLSSYNGNEAFSSMWGEELITLSCQQMVKKLNYKNDHSIHEYFHLEEDSRWKYLQKKQTAHKEICDQILYGSQMDRTALSMDYLTTLRTICRAEMKRSGNNMKRNNRFHHYLKSIGFDSSVQVFDETCEILDHNLSSSHS